MIEKEMKIYSDIDEIEKKFLPKYHYKQVIQKASNNLKYSEELADILLDKKIV